MRIYKGILVTFGLVSQAAIANAMPGDALGMSSDMSSTMPETTLSAASSAMTQFPNGSYSGKGRWIDASGNTGHYKVSTQVENNTVSSTYQFDSRQMMMKLHADFDQTGAFTLKGDNSLEGSGFCMSVQCHIYAHSSDITMLEETVTFFQGHLYKIGSMMMNGKEVRWEEDSMATTGTGMEMGSGTGMGTGTGAGVGTTSIEK